MSVAGTTETAAQTDPRDTFLLSSDTIKKTTRMQTKTRHPFSAFKIVENRKTVPGHAGNTAETYPDITQERTPDQHGGKRL